MIAENPASKKCKREGCGTILTAERYATMHQFARTKYCCPGCASADRKAWHTLGKSRQFSVGDISRPVTPCMFCGQPATSRLANSAEVASCEACEPRMYREVLERRVVSERRFPVGKKAT